MRALTAILTLACLALAVACLAPAAAAATSTGAAVSLGIVGLGALAAGITVQLTSRQTDDNGVTTTRQHNLDSDSPTYGADLAAFAEAKEAEGAAPVRAELAAAEAARDAHRDTVIGEIVRVAQLQHAASKAEGEFDAESETAFLQSLDAPRLKLHFDKARQAAAELKAPTQQTAPGAPATEGADAAYGHVTVN